MCKADKGRPDKRRRVIKTTQTIRAATTSFSNGGPIKISAVNAGLEPEPVVSYSSDIEVLGLTGVVTQVSVTLNGLSHSSPDDLDMLLIGPSGQTFHFWSDVGGANAVEGTSSLAGQPLGGGLNSTLMLPTPLAPNASVSVNFLLGVQQTGRFRFFINVEALP